MSMNLYVEFNKADYQLAQTPAFVIKMCLMDDDGFIECKRGKKAKRSLYMYIEWLTSTLSGVYKTRDEIEEYEVRKNNIFKHRDELLDLMKKSKSILVFEK